MRDSEKGRERDGEKLDAKICVAFLYIFSQSLELPFKY